MAASAHWSTLIGGEGSLVNALGKRCAAVWHPADLTRPSKALLELDELVDAVDHLLDELYLGVADAGFVGDVEFTLGAGGGVLPLGSASLDAERVAVRLELVHTPRLVELGQL